MKTITIPETKADHLLQLAKLSDKALKKLADKLVSADATRIAAIEKKIDTYATFI
jgi:cell division protein ZapA (FtsZ GTPase activity inhibitor)